MLASCAAVARMTIERGIYSDDIPEDVQLAAIALLYREPCLKAITVRMYCQKELEFQLEFKGLWRLLGGPLLRRVEASKDYWSMGFDISLIRCGCLL
jgi:hypothetical protein